MNNTHAAGGTASRKKVDAPLVHSIISSAHGDDIPLWVLENEDNALNDVLQRIQSKAARRYTGKDLIQRMEECRCLPLGCPPIDSMLRGGVLEGHVMEVFGGSGTGKTQLCHMAASVTASRGERVLYVDTNASFSVQRMMDILGHVVGGRCDHLLDMVTVVQCVSRVDDVFACIDSYLQNHPCPSMILIDSFGWIMAPLIGGGVSYDSGHDMMFSSVMYLKQIAMNHQCAVIITNHTVRGGAEEDVGAEFRLKRSALGDTWPGHTHVRLQLVSKDEVYCCEGKVERRAFLHQNTLGIPSHTCVTFDM